MIQGKKCGLDIGTMRCCFDIIDKNYKHVLERQYRFIYIYSACFLAEMMNFHFRKKS